MKDENSFRSLAEFRERFYLSFCIIAAIRPQRELFRGIDIPSDSNEDDTFTVKFFKASKPNKLAYNKLFSLK